MENFIEREKKKIMKWSVPKIQELKTNRCSFCGVYYDYDLMYCPNCDNEY